jgi:hypothetical protein
MTFATIHRPLSAAASVKDPAGSKICRPRAWAFPLLVATALFLPTVARGQDDPAQKRPTRRPRATTANVDQDRQLVVRVYPVEDLLQTVSDYPYRGGLPAAVPHGSVGGFGGGMGGMGGGTGGGMGGMGGGGGGMFSVPSAEAPPQVLRQFGGGGAGPANNAARAEQRESRQQELLEMIQSYVKGDWGNAGADCSIFRSSLIVRNTEEIQKAVADILQAVRATSNVGRSVTIEATWLVLTPQQLETLRRISAGKRDAPAADLRKSFDELVQQATAIHGHITCLNGQQVHLATGRRQVIASGGTPTVGMGAVGYTPIVSVLNLGAVLQVTASLSDSGKVLVDLQSVVTQWKEPAAPIQISSQAVASSDEKKVEGPLVHSMVTIDRADVGTQEWASTVSIPIGQPVYIGSVTFGGDKAGHLEPAQNPELALMIEVHSSSR